MVFPNGAFHIGRLCQFSFLCHCFHFCKTCKGISTQLTVKKHPRHSRSQQENRPFNKEQQGTEFEGNIFNSGSDSGGDA